VFHLKSLSLFVRAHRLGPARRMWAIGDCPSLAEDALSPVLARTVRRPR
jgi:hypothetical protein